MLRGRNGAWSARVAAGLALLVAALGLLACGASGSGSGGRVTVVAAENVYGDIVRQIGGRYVDVTSILSDPRADPHLFEPGTASTAAVADADVVIDNGLGYDAFMDKLLSAAPSSHRRVVSMADVLGLGGPGANPHLWYDLPRVPQMAEAIAEALEDADPSHRGAYQDGLARFDRAFRPVLDAVDRLRSHHAGTPVAYTEPVPGYLLEAAGLVVRTPPSFARAIEEGTDPSPQDVAIMESLLRDRGVRVLLVNSQATSPITDRMRQLADQNGIPVVTVTETLPPGLSFQQWQLDQVRALAKALGP